MKKKNEKRELEKMTTEDLRAYGRICKMSKGMISNDPERWVRHSEIVEKILATRQKV